jgi:hypothetical protein
MSDILKVLAGPNTCEESLRERATRLAILLGTKSARNKRIIIGQDHAPMRIPLHTDEFYCFVIPSDSTYAFTAECRKKKADVADFAVNLVTQVGFTELCPAISESLDVPVYGNKLFCEEEIAARLLTPKLTELIGRINFVPITHFLLSPIQLHVNSKFVGIEQCVQQSQLFRELVVSVYQEALQRTEWAGGQD